MIILILFIIEVREIKLFVTLSKRTLCVILALMVISIIIIGQLSTAATRGIDGSINAKRCEYIKDLGYNIDETAIFVKNITIPSEFSDVYLKYNQMQESAGFDLSRYKGESAVLYTYKITDEEDMLINLIVQNGVVIGGDVSSVRIDGDMKPLKRKE